MWYFEINKTACKYIFNCRSYVCTPTGALSTPFDKLMEQVNWRHVYEMDATETTCIFERKAYDE